MNKAFKLQMIEIVRAAQEAQVCDGVTPEQYGELDEITYKAMELAGDDSGDIQKFLKSGGE